MFKYRIIRYSESGGHKVEEVVFETKDEKEILGKIPPAKLEELKNIAKETIQKKKETLGEKSELIYSPITVRTYLEDTILEIEYIPIQEVIEEIEEKIGKKLNIDLNKPISIAINKKRNVLHVKQYSKEKKQNLSIFTTTRFTERLLILFSILKELLELEK